MKSMNIKIIDFFNKEYEGSKARIILMSCLGGGSAVLMLAVINQAAELIAHTDVNTEIRLAILYVAICAVSIVSKRDMLNQTLVMAEKVVRKVRVRLIDKLRHTELRFMEKTKRGEIYAQIVEDTQVISQTSPNLINGLDSAFSSLAIFVYISFLSLTGFVFALCSITLMFGILFFNYAKMKDELVGARKKEADFFDALADTLGGFKEIKISSQKNNALFADIETLARESQMVKTNAEIRYDNTIVTFFAMYFAAVAVIVFLVPMFSHARSDSLVKIVTSVLFVLGMLAIVFRGVYSVFKANVAVENLKKLEDELDTYGTFTRDRPLDIPGSFQKIVLNSVTFKYTGKEDETLFTVGPVDLSIRQGEIIFIVGGNGSGKSTLLKLLTGLYYPMAGDGFITLDDLRVTRKNYQTYRELFSIIFTDFHLFKKLYGLESVEKHKISSLLKKMGIHTKTKYSNGRFTNTDLSTGQRKRLAYIAAILEDKPVYVFDEWAADQDPVYRKNFYEKFLEDMRAMRKTIIAVTHDDKYFGKADRVIKMEEGLMTEEIIT